MEDQENREEKAKNRQMPSKNSLVQLIGLREC